MQRLESLQFRRSTSSLDDAYSRITLCEWRRCEVKGFWLGVVVTVLAGWILLFQGFIPISGMYPSPSQCWSNQVRTHVNDARYRCIAILVYHL